MSQQVRSWIPLPRGVVISIVLHSGLAILLSLKPRIVTLTIGPESGLLQATLVAVPTDLSTGRPLSAPEASQQSAKQRPPPVEPPPRLAEKPSVKKVQSKSSPTIIEPPKDSTTGQLVKVAQATPPPLKQATAPTKKNVKVMPVKGEESRTSKGEGKTASTTAPRAGAADLDQFFGQLAASTASGGARGASTQQCNQYATQIKSAIQANLIQDQGYQGRRCEIALQLAADGTIVRAEARQGDGLVCAAALRAVGITGRVPKPPDPALYELFKAIIISFEL